MSTFVILTCLIRNVCPKFTNSYYTADSTADSTAVLHTTYVEPFKMSNSSSWAPTFGGTKMTKNFSTPKHSKNGLIFKSDFYPILTTRTHD